MKILVIDDEKTISDMLCEMILDRGHAAIVANDSGTAFQVLHNRIDEIDAVITDINIGFGLDGWEMAAIARNLKSELAIVYMSGDSGAEWETKGVSNRILLAKPFTVNDVSIVLENIDHPAHCA